MSKKLEDCKYAMDALRVDAGRLVERVDAAFSPEEFKAKTAKREAALAAGAKPRHQYEMSHEMQRAHGTSTQHQDNFLVAANAHRAHIAQPGYDKAQESHLAGIRQHHAALADKEKGENFKHIRSNFNPKWNAKTS